MAKPKTNDPEGDLYVDDAVDLYDGLVFDEDLDTDAGVM